MQLIAIFCLVQLLVLVVLMKCQLLCPIFIFFLRFDCFSKFIELLPSLIKLYFPCNINFNSSFVKYPNKNLNRFKYWYPWNIVKAIKNETLNY